MADRDTRILGGVGPFPDTSWSTISSAQAPEGTAYEGAMDRLFRRYWSPVYFHVRRHWARNNEEAKDMTQAFFTAFFEKDFIGSVSAERGRFRNFVLVALRNFLSKQRRAEGAQKRRPRQGLVSLDKLVEDNSGFDVRDASSGDQEKQFEADWKKAVIRAAIERLRGRAGKGQQAVYVEVLVMYDLENPEEEKLTYAEVGEAFGLSASQVTNGLHWARKAFRECFIEEVADQVSSAEDLRAEVRALFDIEI